MSASAYSPKVTLPLEHPLTLADTLALKIDLLQQQGVDLLELHPVFVVQLLVLGGQALDIRLKPSLVLVDRLAQCAEDIQLILVDQGHCTV